MKRRKKVSGAEQTRESWRYPGDKLNRNLLGRAEGLASLTAHRTGATARSHAWTLSSSPSIPV